MPELDSTAKKIQTQFVYLAIKMSEKFRLDRKFCFQNTLYTKYITVIIESIGPSIILRSIYRGYIVFAFSVLMFVCLLVCLFVNFFSVEDFSATTWVRILKFGTKLDSDELYCATKTATY